MSIQVQLRRGTTASHATFVGALGEVTVDTTKKTLVVHDGATLGGFPMGASVIEHIGTPANAHAASAITNTPSGALSSTTVQGALDELAGGKAEIGENGSITSLTALSSVNGGQLAGMRNRIINGGFAVNQRVYVSGAAVGTGLYGHDRWKMAASGDTYTYSTTNNKTTVTIPAGKVFRQVVEGLNLETGTYCLSWQGTAQGKIGAGAYGASGITGAITGGTNTTIEFGPGTVSNVQLELGSVATPFEQRPYGLELMLCQRYFYSSPGVDGLVGCGMVAAPSFALIHVPVGQAMRTAPIFVPPPSPTFRYGGSDYPVSAFDAGLAGSCVVIGFTALGAVNGHAGVLRGSDGPWSLSAEL